MSTSTEENENLNEVLRNIHFFVHKVSVDPDCAMAYFDVNYYGCAIINIEVLYNDDNYEMTLPKVSHGPWQKEKPAIAFHLEEDMLAIRYAIRKFITETKWILLFFEENQR